MFLYRCRSTTDTLLHWQEIDILTDVWVYDIDSREKLETIITEIFSYISKYKIDIPEESCLVLEFRNSGRCGYYFVNHEEHRLFWLDVYNGPGTMDSLFNLKVKVEYTPSLIGKSFDARKNYFIDIEIRIGHEMKSLYWFVQRFNLCYMILFFFFTWLVFIDRHHNHLFPNIRPLPSGAILEIQDVLIHAIGGMY